MALKHTAKFQWQDDGNPVNRYKPAAHMLRGVSCKFGPWFSPAFLPGPSTADSVKLWQGTEGMFSNAQFKGKVILQWTSGTETVLFTGTGLSYVSWTTQRKPQLPLTLPKVAFGEHHVPELIIQITTINSLGLLLRPVLTDTLYSKAMLRYRS